MKRRRKRKAGCAGTVAAVLIAVSAAAVFISMDTDAAHKCRDIISGGVSFVAQKFNHGSELRETPPNKNRGGSGKPNSALITIENAASCAFAPYKEGILCASANHLEYIDIYGNTIWETDTDVVNPLLSSEGSYILLAEKGRGKLCLYSDKKLLYDIDDPDSIMTVKVSQRGDAVAVTDKSSYRGGISVYNKSGSRIYSWASGSDSVISADISSSRRIAVSLLNTDKETKSLIYLFDTGSMDSYSQIDAGDAVVYNVQFTGNTLTAFGDNRFIVLNDKGKILSQTELNSAQLTHSAMDSGGNKLLSIDDGNVPMLNVYDKKGAAKESINIDGVVSFIDIMGDTILYNIGRDIYTQDADSYQTVKYPAAMDIKKLMLLKKNVFAVVYSGSMQIYIVTMEDAQ